MDHSQRTINPPVFFTSGGLLVFFVVMGALFTETAGRVFETALEQISTRFGWFYLLAVTFFVGFCLWLLGSRYARIRLGPDDSRPDFNTVTWFSMLFSAGMGIGLVFYGVAEPIFQYMKPAVGEGESTAAAVQAVPTAFFHWGVHAWAVYVVMGVGIAYFGYRRKLPLAIRSAFHPLLGDRIHGSAGHVIDIIAVFGTLFGLATSLGLGALQINAGLDHLFDVGMSRTAQLTIIAIITGAATTSLVTGVDKGIRRLSELNMILAGLLMLFVFLAGPTQYLLNSLVDNIGVYLSDLVHRSFWINAPGDGKWHRSWTLFYWGWWIAWSPFVGMFVARVSRGRTIREFILAVLLVPTAVTCVWLTVFGDTALYLERAGGGIAAAVAADVSTAIYVMLEHLPLSGVTSLLSAAVVAVFFVTSSDSASFVVDMLTSGGHPDPPVWQRVFWALAEGVVAAVLLTASGKKGLTALQAAVVSVGLPFCALMVLMCFSLFRGLRSDSSPAAASDR
jgi:choline/glycine/proline betaine transport protein